MLSELQAACLWGRNMRLPHAYLLPKHEPGLAQTVLAIKLLPLHLLQTSNSSFPSSLALKLPLLCVLCPELLVLRVR